MFKDEQRRTVWDTIRQHDLRAFSANLTSDLVEEAVRRAGVRLGAGPLNAVNLTWLALSSALHWTENFTNILSLTFKLLEDYEAFGSQAEVPLRHVAGLGGGSVVPGTIRDATTSRSSAKRRLRRLAACSP